MISAPDQPYPVLQWLIRYGKPLSLALAALPVLLAIAALAAGYSPLWLIAGGIGAILTFGIARSYVELIMIIADMLLPK